jgi:hypothetical protein
MDTVVASNNWLQTDITTKENMITSITRFPLSPELERDALRQELEAVAPQFKTIPGLIRKYFLLGEDGNTCGGVYLWDSMAEARAFSEGPLRAMIRQKFSVDPHISYYETPVIVDGERAAA